MYLRYSFKTNLKPSLSYCVKTGSNLCLTFCYNSFRLNRQHGLGNETVSYSSTFSQCGARLCWPHRSMNSFSAERSLGLEENVQLLPTFLIRRSRWSSPGSETALPHTPATTGGLFQHCNRKTCTRPHSNNHVCKQMLSVTHSHMQTQANSLFPPHCVYRAEDHTHPVLKQRKCIRISVGPMGAFKVDANIS